MKQDPIESIGAVRREVRDGERDGKPTRAVVAERTFDTTVDDVWDALTTRERIPRWFLPIEGDLRLGGRYQLEGNAGGEVTACDPPTHLAVTWEFGGQLSWVDVLLSEDSAGGTRLRLEHVAPIDPHWDQFGPGAVGIGWDLTLLGLGEHLLTGESVKVDEEALAGPEWVEVMIRSNDAWCQADIASGTPEDVARGAAERTIAAYTGQGPDGETPTETPAETPTDEGNPPEG
jgi:uncharacterized protein YndB with AHSA1/START domain